MESTKIAFLGDIMPGGVIADKNSGFVDKPVQEHLNSFDLRVATLESAIGENIDFDSTKMQNRQNIIYSKNYHLDKLKNLNISVVSLANNHIIDLGVEGIKNTITQLQQRDILFCGAGMNLDEASKPAVVHINDKSIAFLAFCYTTGDIKTNHIATPDKPGINPLSEDNVISGIKKNRNLYDYIFVLPHWGREYTSYPTKEQRDLSLKMIKAGADGVFGSHTHQIQPHINIKGKPVFFSLGNFLFPDFYMYPPRPIWYPDDISDVSNVKISNDYPFPISKPLLRVWKNEARIGMIANAEITGRKIATSYDITELSRINTVTFSNISSINKYKLFLIGQLIKRDLFFLIRVLKSATFRLNKMKNSTK